MVVAEHLTYFVSYKVRLLFNYIINIGKSLLDDILGADPRRTRIYTIILKLTCKIG
jgi:hypothetical protein